MTVAPRPGQPKPPRYEFFEPTRSSDHRTVTLPIGGESTLFSRHAIENLSSWMLWRYFPPDFLDELEEGVTETIDPSHAPQTSWRRRSQTIYLAAAVAK